MIDPARVPAVDVLEAHRRLGEPGGGPGAGGPAVLLDVREVGEFVAGRADGAELLPLSGFLAGYRDLPTDRPILVICATGNRSASVTAFLRQQGWTDVVNVSGGTVAWERAGLPIRRGPLAAAEGERPR